ncbi:hypothetical protein PanWU01x14_062580 [Parasponia andersonii]|uniref:Uncharacterized protein n=1 Tax=Parasponia andersonii TaxID=3476 RepID=A0A2P5DHK5_PARAD|nr:hypothetical protein PanWU01x14_062580 [Parasponia andersonii]
MAFAYVQEVLPPVLNSSAEQPALFDGTTRLQIYLSEVVKHDITAGRPKLAAWIEFVGSRSNHRPYLRRLEILALLPDFAVEISMSTFAFWSSTKIDAYKVTKTDPKELVEFFKRLFSVPSL